MNMSIAGRYKLLGYPILGDRGYVHGLDGKVLPNENFNNMYSVLTPQTIKHIMANGCYKRPSDKIKLRYDKLKVNTHISMDNVLSIKVSFNTKQGSFNAIEKGLNNLDLFIFEHDLLRCKGCTYYKQYMAFDHVSQQYYVAYNIVIYVQLGNNHNGVSITDAINALKELKDLK